MSCNQEYCDCSDCIARDNFSNPPNRERPVVPPMNEEWAPRDSIYIKMMIAALRFKRKEQNPPMSYIDSHIETLEKVLRLLE